MEYVMVAHTMSKNVDMMMATVKNSIGSILNASKITAFMIKKG